MELIDKRAGASLESLSQEGEGEAVIVTKHVVDLDNDVTEDGAIQEQDALLLIGHTWSGLPLGKGRTYETRDDVRFRFKVNTDLAQGRELLAYLRWDLQQQPSLAEWSYGFRPLPGGSRKSAVNGQAVRIFQALDTGSPGLQVIEASVVVKGAGIDTRTVSAKDEGDLIFMQRKLIDLQRTLIAGYKRRLELQDRDVDEEVAFQVKAHLMAERMAARIASRHGGR